jgi:hypothetical protein
MQLDDYFTCLMNSDERDEARGEALLSGEWRTQMDIHLLLTCVATVILFLF